MTQFTKQPSENLDYDFDFSNAFPSGDNVSSAVVTISPSGPTSGSKTISGQTVKQWISGGADGVTYKVTCTATSQGGRIKEAEFKLNIVNQ